MRVISSAISRSAESEKARVASAHHLSLFRYAGEAFASLWAFCAVLTKTARPCLLRAEPANPYLHLLAATRRLIDSELPSPEGVT